MRILSIVILAAAVVGIAGLALTGGEAGSPDEMEVMQKVLSERGVSDLTGEAFYWCEWNDGMKETGAARAVFENLGFEEIMFSTHPDSYIIRGKLPSGTEGSLMLSFLENGRVFSGFKIIDSDVRIVRKTLKRVITAMPSRIGNGEITWSIKGTIPKSLNSEEMRVWASEILSSLNGSIEIEQLHQGALNILAHSPHFTTAPEINGKLINLNLVFKADALEDITRIYAGVPFVSTAY